MSKILNTVFSTNFVQHICGAIKRDRDAIFTVLFGRILKTERIRKQTCDHRHFGATFTHTHTHSRPFFLSPPYLGIPRAQLPSTRENRTKLIPLSHAQKVYNPKLEGSRTCSSSLFLPSKKKPAAAASASSSSSTPPASVAGQLHNCAKLGAIGEEKKTATT